jgi:Holliday junction DNA helicase RuvB
MKNEMIISLVTGDINYKVDLNVLNAIIGQEEAKGKIKFFVKSNSPELGFPTMLFTGSAGLGKTYMSKKVAEALGRDLIEINCKTIQSDKDFIEGILVAKVCGNTPKTILLDEAHVLSPAITTILLTLLNPNKDNKNCIEYGNWALEYDMSRVNLIFATTDAHKMSTALINRCTEIYFSLYTHDELINILKYYIGDINLKCDNEDLAYACRGRARDTYFLSQNILRYCKMNNLISFNDKDWKELKGIFGINKNGLSTQEIKLMKIVASHGPISVNNIAIMMGVNANNIESEIEVRPRELGFIESGARGRILTETGKEYLRKI